MGKKGIENQYVHPHTLSFHRKQLCKATRSDLGQRKDGALSNLI